MLTRGSIRSWSLLLGIFLGCAHLHAAGGAAADRTSKAQVRDAVRQAVEIEHPDTTIDRMTISDRDDLEDQLSQISEKTARNISFYEVDWSSGDNSMWVVDSGDPAQTSSELYSFERTDNVQQSSRKFNDLISHLALSVQNDKLESLARFFLACCVREAPGEIVSDEDGLHNSVESYYMRTFGDVWRALEAYVQWWQMYQTSPVDFSPENFDRSGARGVTLERLVFNSGMQPKLEQWAIEVSHDGDVRVLSVESIFPKQNEWLSYDFRSTIAPPDFSDNDDDLLPARSVWTAMKDAGSELKKKIHPPVPQVPAAPSHPGLF